MHGSMGHVSYLGLKRGARLEPLALSQTPHHFSGSTSFVTTELIVKRGQMIIVVFQIQSKS